MKQRFVLSLLIALFILPLQAQEQMHEKHNRHEELVKILQITDDQASEFLLVMTAQREQRKNVRGQYNESRKAQRKAMKQLHLDTIEKLQDVLTDSQIEAFKAVAAHRYRQRGHKSAHLRKEGA